MSFGLQFTQARLRRFGAEEQGSGTIEAVLWVPMFALLLFMVTDVSFIFNGRSEALRIVQDGNRSFSTGRLTTELETETYIDEALAAISPGATIETVLDEGVITTIATIPINDLVVIGTVPGLSDFNITVQSQHYLEY